MSVQIKLNIGEIRTYLKSPEVQSMLQEQVDRIASTANGMCGKHNRTGADVYKPYVDIGKYTAIGKVAATPIGRKIEAKYHYLRKSIK